MKRPKVYFSLRSPFSWMAVRRLEEQVPDIHERADFIPFWEPDEKLAAALAERGGSFPYTAMSKAKHLYILQDTKRLAARFGYAMRWPVDVDPWWELPHMAWLKAKHLGVERRFYDAVTAARWERGENICEEPVLRSIIEAAGLDPAPLLGAVDDDQIWDEAVQAQFQVYSDDVFGVPYFKVGFQRFWGLDRLSGFIDALGGSATTQSEPIAGIPSAIVDQPGSMDVDTAGGCG